MYCPKCGFELKDEAIFCSKCGTNVEFNANDAPPEHPAATPSAPDSSKEGQITRLIIVLIIAAIIAAVSYFSIAGITYDTSSTTTTSEADTTITLSTFNQLQPGMTYDQVIAIIGTLGDLTSQTIIPAVEGVSPESKIEMYSWANVDGSNALLSFSDGVMDSKTQALLK